MQRFRLALVPVRIWLLLAAVCFIVPAMASSVTIAQSNTGGTLILGSPTLSKEACIAYIVRHNPAPLLSCTVEELVELYFEEAIAEGVRPDLALSQAILETGFFAYGGTVLAEQNNYCGLGTTGGGVKGAWFVTPREGVRAHIQHLLAYTTDRWPSHPVVDPRYELVRDIEHIFAQCSTWESLNGKWAVPGNNYGEKIIRIFHNILRSESS